MQPPLPALNALITAQGNIYMLDRAFAVMQEFEDVFNTKPNADTYYALLGAIAKSREPRVDNLLHILSDMDDAGFSPDSGCFSLLLETMLKCGDKDGMTNILQHVRDSSTTTSTTTGSTAATVGSESGSESSEGSEQMDIDIEEVVVDASHLPALRILRQLAVHFTKQQDSKQCEMVLQMIRDKQGGGKALPHFFTQRLDRLIKLNKQEDAEK
jgi:hypothetical protein